MIDYIEQNYATIEKDMNCRNSTAKKKLTTGASGTQKVRKLREELSISAVKTIKNENVESLDSVEPDCMNVSVDIDSRYVSVESDCK